MLICQRVEVGRGDARCAIAPISAGPDRASGTLLGSDGAPWRVHLRVLILAAVHLWCLLCYIEHGPQPGPGPKAEGHPQPPSLRYQKKKSEKNGNIIFFLSLPQRRGLHYYCRGTSLQRRTRGRGHPWRRTWVIAVQGRRKGAGEGERVEAGGGRRLAPVTGQTLRDHFHLTNYSIGTP